MATILKTDNFINISAIAADVELQDIFKDNQEHKIKRIEFASNTDNDICVVKQGMATGAIITTLNTDTKGVDRIIFDDDGQFMKPMIDFSAGAFVGTHTLVIELA